MRFAVSCLAVINPSCANFVPDYIPPVSHAYIGTDGQITPASLPINRSGTLYTLIGEVINYTLEIQCSDITIDGSGFALHGTSAWTGNGLTITNEANITVRNLTISTYMNGVCLTNVDSIFFLDGAVTGCVESTVFEGCTNSKFSRNNFDTSLFGKQISNCLFSDNYFKDGAVVFSNSNHNNITGNYCTIGASVSFGEYGPCCFNLISNNSMRGGGIGIFLLAGSDFNTAIQNDIQTAHASVTIGNSHNNVFWGNYFGNSKFGVDLEITPKNNTFFQNSFVNNSIPVFTRTSINRWDNGSIGNYWNGYQGLDANNDGIGDTAYSINPYNIDHFPLMAPVDYTAPSIKLLSPENTNYTTNSIPLNLTVNEPSSQIVYCLDGEENIPINGNITLTGLANGFHNITVLR